MPDSTFRFVALHGAAVAMSVPTAVAAQMIAPGEPSQNQILVPRPNSGPDQNETQAQSQDPSEK
jgi:hypothetical protein